MVLIILNRPIASPPSALFQRLWQTSSVRICADGGANRLYDATVVPLFQNQQSKQPKQQPQYHDDDDDAQNNDNDQTTTMTTYNTNNNNNNNKYIPNVIRGDLDSLRNDVRRYYERFGTSVQYDPCQNTNDLDKVLQLLLVSNRRSTPSSSSSCQQVQQQGHQSLPPFSATSSTTNGAEMPMTTNNIICVYGAFGGRFDQEMASIQALFQWSTVCQEQNPKTKLILYDDDSCAFLLPPVIRNEIRLPFYGDETNETEQNETNDKKEEMTTQQQQQQNKESATTTTTRVGEGPTCGLIPIGHRCEFVHTTGLKWNLDGSVALEFGQLVSTSNRAMKDVITVQASHPLVFTAEMTTTTTTSSVIVGRAK